MVKNLLANAGEVRNILILGSGRSLAGEHGKPLQYSCLENPMERGAWWATVHRVTKTGTQLSDFTFTFRTVKVDKESQRAERSS